MNKCGKIAFPPHRSTFVAQPMLSLLLSLSGATTSHSMMDLKMLIDKCLL